MSFATPRVGKICLAIAGAVAVSVIAIGDPFLMVIASPAIGGPLAISIVVFVAWLLGPVLRTYLHGSGRQEHWGYCGHTVRGERDADGQLWISLRDCHFASGLDLESRQLYVPQRHKRKHETYGWLVTRAGMLQLLDSHPGDIFELNKLRLFLERQVWQTPRE